MGSIGGFCHLYIGQEAVVVGMQKISNNNDTVITSYRDHGHMLACGMDPKNVMAELTGRAGGYSKGKGVEKNEATTLESMYLSKGYFRFTSTSTDIHECPYFSNCLGGTINGTDVGCLPGSSGPLCSIWYVPDRVVADHSPLGHRKNNPKMKLVNRIKRAFRSKCF